MGKSMTKTEQPVVQPAMRVRILSLLLAAATVPSLMLLLEALLSPSAAAALLHTIPPEPLGMLPLLSLPTLRLLSKLVARASASVKHHHMQLPLALGNWLCPIRAVVLISWAILARRWVAVNPVRCREMLSLAAVPSVLLLTMNLLLLILTRRVLAQGAQR